MPRNKADSRQEGNEEHCPDGEFTWNPRRNSIHCIVSIVLLFLHILRGHRMKLFTGNLSRDVTEADLRALFEPFGTLGTVVIVRDKFSGASKGFGFVEMPVKAEAEAAIAALYRTQLKGQSLDVTEARPQAERKSSRGGRNGGRRRFR